MKPTKPDLTFFRRDVVLDPITRVRMEHPGHNNHVTTPLPWTIRQQHARAFECSCGATLFLTAAALQLDDDGFRKTLV